MLDLKTVGLQRSRMLLDSVDWQVQEKASLPSMAGEVGALAGEVEAEMAAVWLPAPGAVVVVRRKTFVGG